MASTQQPLCKVTTDGIKLAKELIGKAHQEFDIVYEVYLANHLPHALYTLCSLGATKDRIQGYHDNYIKKLEPLRSPEFEINPSNWKKHIGTEKYMVLGAYHEYLQFFDKEVKQHGLKGTFSKYFPTLMGHSLGEALHPLIHIGFAMEFSDPYVLSEGLTYACTYPLKGASKILDLDSKLLDQPSSLPSVSVVQLIDQVRDMSLPQLTSDIGNFHHKSEYLLEHCGEQFKDLVQSWDLSSPESFPAKLNELTESSILAALSTYPDKIDFFLVHGITSNHGVRAIFPHLDEHQQKTLLRVNLTGLLTAYVVQKMPKIEVNSVLKYKSKNGNDDMVWENIISQAISREEEHIAKVVRSVIHYMENVSVSKRSPLFTEEFCRQCAYKVVDVLKTSDDYIFE